MPSESNLGRRPTPTKRFLSLAMNENSRKANTAGGQATASRAVPGVGLEPTRPQWPRDFKSLVSTIPPSGQQMILRLQK